MYHNQYRIIRASANPGLFTGTLASAAADLLICVNLCLADQPRAGGGNCNSVDWWYISLQCHLSEGTSCEPTIYNVLDPSQNKMDALAPYGWVDGNYYEKYCVCGLTANTVAPKVYDYNAGLTGTVVYDSTNMLTNTKPTECPILGCAVYQSDCTTPLSAPESSYISVSPTSPWALTVS